MSVEKVKNIWCAIFISTLTLLSSLHAKADSSVTVDYDSSSTTYTVGANSAKLDLTGVGLSANISLSKNVVVTGGTSNLKGDLSGINMELTTTTFGIFYNLFNDLDLEGGSGSRLGLGLTSSDNTLKTRISGTDYSTKASSLNVGAALESAISENMSFAGGISGDTKDFKPVYSLGLKYGTSLGAFTASYSSYETDVETVNVKTTGFSVGYGINF